MSVWKTIWRQSHGIQTHVFCDTFASPTIGNLVFYDTSTSPTIGNHVVYDTFVSPTLGNHVFCDTFASATIGNHVFYETFASPKIRTHVFYDTFARPRHQNARLSSPFFENCTTRGIPATTGDSHRPLAGRLRAPKTSFFVTPPAKSIENYFEEIQIRKTVLTFRSPRPLNCNTVPTFCYFWKLQPL